MQPFVGKSTSTMTRDLYTFASLCLSLLALAFISSPRPEPLFRPHIPVRSKTFRPPTMQRDIRTQPYILMQVATSTVVGILTPIRVKFLDQVGGDCAAVNLTTKIAGRVSVELIQTCHGQTSRSVVFDQPGVAIIRVSTCEGTVVEKSVDVLEKTRTPLQVPLSSPFLFPESRVRRDMFTVEGDCVVPRGSQLTLPPGVVLVFGPSARLLIKGTVHFEGSFEHPILVTGHPTEHWGQLYVHSGGTLRATHTMFAGGGNFVSERVFGHSNSVPLLFGCADSVVVLVSCSVVDSPGKGPSSKGAEVFLTDTLISRVDTGGEHSNSVFEGSWLFVSEIPDGDRIVDDDDNDGLYIQGVHKSGRGCIVSDSTFVVGEDDAIDHNGALLIVERTYIQSWENEGIATSNGGRVIIDSCSIQRCGVGVEAGYGTPLVVVSYSSIQQNGVGARFGDDYNWGTSGHLTVWRSEIRTNTIDVQNLVHFSATERAVYGKEQGSRPYSLSVICCIAETIHLDHTDVFVTSSSRRDISALSKSPVRRFLPSLLPFCTLAGARPYKAGSNKLLSQGQLECPNQLAIPVVTSQLRPGSSHQFKVTLLSGHRSQHIPAFFGVTSLNGTEFFVQEYLINCTSLNQGSLEWPYLPSLLESVDFSNVLRVGRAMHGDLKPSNFLQCNGCVYSVDVDDIWLLPSGQSDWRWDNSHIGCGRRTCDRLGDLTILHAPECVDCTRNFNEGSELWSLGILVATTGIDSSALTSSSDKSVRSEIMNGLLTRVGSCHKRIVGSLCQNNTRQRASLPTVLSLANTCHITKPWPREEWVSRIRQLDFTGGGRFLSVKEEGSRDHCGFSARFISSQQAFMLKAHCHTSDQIPWDNEFLWREVLTSMLDDVLGLSVVPPAVGRLVRVHDLSPLNLTQESYTLESCCVPVRNSGYVPISVSVWIEGVQKSSTLSTEYVAFLYLAGCMKSRHNHFSFDDRSLSIDNDRCFTPMSITEKSMPYEHAERWDGLVRTLFNCDPAMNNVVRALLSVVTARRTSLSRVLLNAAAMDEVLGNFTSFPWFRELLSEVDFRFYLLQRHLNRCRFGFS